MEFCDRITRYGHAARLLWIEACAVALHQYPLLLLLLLLLYWLELTLLVRLPNHTVIMHHGIVWPRWCWQISVAYTMSSVNSRFMHMRVDGDTRAWVHRIFLFLELQQQTFSWPNDKQWVTS
jgi:hypothetical protein